MTLGQGHDTLLVCGQQLCEILSISAKGLRRHGPYKVDGQTSTDRQTDGRTDGRTDIVIPIYPYITFFAGRE